MLMETVISSTIRDLLPKRRDRFTKKEDQVDKIKRIQADVVAQQTVNTKHKVHEAGKDNTEGGGGGGGGANEKQRNEI